MGSCGIGCDRMVRLGIREGIEEGGRRGGEGAGILNGG